jgi:two-component system chemotaxis response regulator CheY
MIEALPARAPRPSAAAPPARILIVDDSSLARLYYRDVLEKGGFEVEQALNGVEAMEKVLTQPFDLVIADVNMPRMDGFSFLRSLRRNASDVATLPVLVISTEAETQDRDEARTAGANFYLVKPVSEVSLLRHALVLTGRRP